MYCIFCYKEFFDTGKSPTELNFRRKNRLKICQAFYNTIHRVLGVQSKCTLGKDALESCCTDCLHIINNYCKLAFETQCLQLRLNWQTEQLLKVIEMADTNGGRRRRFRENYINSEEISTISKFRKEIVEKSANEIRRHGPKVLLDRINHAMLKNHLPENFKACNSKKNAHKNKRNKVKVKAAPLKISTATSLCEISNDPGMESEPMLNECKAKVLNLNLPHMECVDEAEEGSIKLDVHSDSFDIRTEEVEALCVEPKTEVEFFDIDEAYCLQETSEHEPFIQAAELIVYEEPYTAVDAISNCRNEALVLTNGNNDKMDFILPSNDTEHEVVGSALVCHIPGCGKSFDSENSYQWHHIRQHMKIHNAVPLPLPAIRKKWICSKCNMQYSTKFNLKRHATKQHRSGNSVNRWSKNIIAPRKQQRTRCIGVGSVQQMIKKSDQSFQQIVRWRSLE